MAQTVTQSLATRVVALEDTVARLLDTLSTEGILINDMVMDIGMFHGLAPKSRGTKRSASEVSPEAPADVDSDLDSHESPGEPKSYSCAYAGNENMTGCKQFAVYYAKGKSNKHKGWHRVCCPCFKWLVSNGSLCREEATRKLDD